MAHVSTFVTDLPYSIVLCYNVVIYSKGRVLKIYKTSLSNLSVVGFRCKWLLHSSNKSFSLFWNTRALAQWSLVVNDLSMTLSGIWALVGKLVASLMLILRLIFSNLIASLESLLVEAIDVSQISKNSFSWVLLEKTCLHWAYFRCG